MDDSFGNNFQTDLKDSSLSLPTTVKCILGCKGMANDLITWWVPGS